MKHYRRIIQFILFMFVVTSCALLTPKANLHTLKWSDRQQQLTAVKQWHIQGAISASNKRNSWSAHLHWQQTGKRYHLRLLGPLGSGQLLLEGQAQQVTLTSSDGQRMTANTAEQLILQQTGWRIPVKALHYWVRGLPIPGQAAAKRLDQQNHLTHLQQGHWHVEYKSYTSVNGIDLPRKIYLNNGAIKVKLVIRRWRV